ncbi:MAG: tRNA uridine-5-carboxymethylaminomethyl(34) synthesis GTPase MnmE [Afipia sp.]|nr:tRNA uridine-5-carboxymethylaminomethyl(34) synthesis GTPase MnmE [Afipia sp.]
MHLPDQTIFALSSGRAPSAIAIIRVSGPQAHAAVQRFCGKLPAPRLAHVATLRDLDGSALDESVTLWFPAPQSATGEDVAEFHVHGGRAVIAAMFDALGSIDGLRPAEPGEFTRRAFENGKLDLTEAEGLDDLIHADTDRQRRQALRHLKGLLGEKAESWRQQIIEASALVEAGIDFSDEGDVSSELIAPTLKKIAALKSEIEEVLAASAQSERLREGLNVAIAGPPNAGKSTLLNRLARREAAIVSPHAGTTRDIIEVHLDLDGYPVTLIDTAGVRDTLDPVEQEGVRRARDRARTSDLVLWLVDANDEIAPTLAGTDDHAPVWIVRNKVDLAPAKGGEGDTSSRFDISAARGDGVPALIAALVSYAQDFFRLRRNGAGQPCPASQFAAGNHFRIGAGGAGLRTRRRTSGGRATRIAIHSLGRLTGRVDVEDILDIIFREFCIGK